MMPVQRKKSGVVVSGQVVAGSSDAGLRVRAKKIVVATKVKVPSCTAAVVPAKRVRNYKKHAKKELSEAFPEIVDVLIERAKKGSVTHAKFLFEIGGVKDERPSLRGSRQRHLSLAEILLKEVAKRSETAEADRAEREQAQS